MVVLILVILGLCVGSFVNALVWRLHEQSQQKSKKKNQKASPELSILKGRSLCPNCKHQLAAKDLIPVLSWLSLGGKCRYCHKPISRQYPLVELATALLFAGSYAFWPLDFDSLGTTLFVFWLIFLGGFMALAVYDIMWSILPTKIIRPLIALALVQAVVLFFTANSPFNLLVSVLVSFLIGGGIFYTIFQVSGGKWIGGGDVRLGGLLGLVLADGGLAVLTIFAASVLGCLAAIPLMLAGKATKKTRIPFGPFLIAGAIIARLFGASIIHWYRSQFIY